MSQDESITAASSGPPDLQRASRPRDSERTTRRPAVLWDRLKIILLLVAAWFVMLAAVWGDLRALEPPFADVVALAVKDFGWLLALALLELIRQIHYLIEERSAGYYRFWQQRVWGRSSGRFGRMNDWTRFRVARALKLIFFLFLLANILALFFDTSPFLALFELPSRLLGALPFVFQLLFGFFFVMFQFIGLFWFLSRGGVDTYMPDEVETRFTDVKGQDAVLERVKENMIFLEDPESIEERGGHVPSGILLWGPPGTGKTLIAQAAAGETAKPYVFVDPGAFINMFMGVGILKVKGLYRKLRKLALRYGGVIVFFDEADSLGSRGQTAGGGGWSYADIGSPWTIAPSCNGLGYLSASTRDVLFQTSLSSSLEERSGKPTERIIMGGMGGGNMGTLQSLLSEMQGLQKPRGFFNRVIRRLLGLKPKPPPKYRILHIFATNMPQALDEAMLRPGRVDRIYKVGYPQKEGRVSTFEYYLGKVSHELTPEDIQKLATITPYATGATIKDMVNEGVIIAIREGRVAITYADIIRAKQLKEHGLPDDHEYIVRERHAVAVHEACHAVVAYRLRRHAVIDIATIERRGDVGGFVSSIPPEDQFVDWRSERDVDVMTFLASLAGERMFYDGDNSAGVGGDMRGATSVATLMEGFSAMGESIASHSVTKFGVLARGRASSMGEDGMDRNFLESELGRRVERKLQELYQRTWTILEENRAEVLAIAHALEAHKSVTGDDIAAIMEGHEGPVVDGRAYRDPAFMAALEAFHTEALAAHKAHGPLTAELPRPAELEVAALPGVANTDAGNGGKISITRGKQLDPDSDQEPELPPERD
jgi:cell division protease FtsH